MDTFTVEDAKVRCTLCPHLCLLSEQKYGICGVRMNSGGKIHLPYHGLLSGVASDPIEKKPLYHFHPGESILSVGFYGCNFKCPFCQNYHISQQVLDNTERTTPEALVDLAIHRNSFGIAYTYSEPLVHFEYVLESSQIARSRGLKNVLVTNGYINTEPAEELLHFTDAANIDLKSFSDDFYKKEIKGGLQPVLDFIRLASKHIHVEVTTLVIPEKNDSDSEIDKIASFIADIDRDIPLHLSCYYPTYKYTIGPTPPERVYELVVLAKKRLNYVYPGNVGSRPTDTLCPKCSNLLISRHGYIVKAHGIADGSCKNCGTKVPVPGL